MFFRPRETSLQLGRPFLTDADRVAIDVHEDESESVDLPNSNAGSLLTSTLHCVKLLNRAYRNQRYLSHLHQWWKPLVAVALLLGLEGIMLWRLISKMILQDNLINIYNHTVIPETNQTCKDLFFIADKEVFCKRSPPADFFVGCSDLLAEICQLNKMAAEAVILSITSILLLVEWGQFKTGKFLKIPQINLSYDEAFLSAPEAKQTILVTAKKLGILTNNKTLQAVVNEFNRKIHDVSQGCARVLIKRLNIVDDIEKLIFDFADLNTNVNKRLALTFGLHKRVGKASHAKLLVSQSKLTRSYLLNSIFDYADIADVPLTESQMEQIELKQLKINQQQMTRMRLR